MCGGIQFNFNVAYAGRVHKEGDNLQLSMYVIEAEEANS